jgi:sec-independent protein translocase protein TatB
MGKIRRMAAEFQGQFQEAMREAEMADLKKQVDTLTSSFDPIETARKEVEGAMEEKPASAPHPETAEAAAWSDPTAAPDGSAAPSEVPAGTDAPAPAVEQQATATQPSDDVTPEAAGGRAA